MKVTRIDNQIDLTNDDSDKSEQSKGSVHTSKKLKESPSKDIQLNAASTVKQHHQVNKDSQSKKKVEAASKPHRQRQETTEEPKQFVEPDFYEVDYLRDYRKSKSGKEEVLVHWKGFSSDEDTWEPVKNLNSELKKDVELLRLRLATKVKSK